MPKQTAKVRAEQVSRTTEQGVLRSKKIELDTSQKMMAEQVAKLQIDKRKSLQHNYNVIQREVFDEAENLKTALKNNDVFFPRKEFKARIDKVKNGLSESPTMVGDAEKTAQKIINKFEKILDEKSSSASGLLEARKDLDKWIKTQKSRAYDTKSEGAFEIALRDIRKATNDIIDEKATNVSVKDSLRKQSSLYGAMDNIAPKAAQEADNAIKRLWQNTARFVPIKGEAFQTLAAFGLAGVLSTVSTPAAGAGLAAYGVYKGGKAVFSPQAKKGLSKLLSVTDEAIKATNDKDLIRQLRLDRALVVELLEEE